MRNYTEGSPLLRPGVKSPLGLPRIVPLAGNNYLSQNYLLNEAILGVLSRSHLPCLLCY